MQVCGLEFGSETIQGIRRSLVDSPAMSRRSLARDVCERMNWVAASGRLKEAACRKALGILGQKGLIDLRPPAARAKAPRRTEVREAASFQAPEVECTLDELGAVDIELVSGRDSRSFQTWNDMMNTHHYLGGGPLCGAQLRYLIRSPVFGCLGGFAFSSAAFALKKRDEYIGWTDAAHRHNLPRVVQNSRFLIRPTVRVKNLASHALSLATARLSRDWLERYGVEPVLVETFVDPWRFSGVCYIAANWVPVGPTSGRRGAENEHGSDVKNILLYPLRRDWQRILRAEPIEDVRPLARPEEPADWAEEELGGARLYDPRLSRRLLELARDFYGQPQAQIPQACGSEARARAAYRFMSNQRVSMDRILEPHIASTIERLQEHKVVLAVQDTSSLNYTAHPATEGLGPINTTKDRLKGLLLHDTMAFTVEGTPLGLLDAQCWARDPETAGKRSQRKELPIEQKESMKWLRSYRAVAEAQKLRPETMLVSVGDREADVYELFLEKVNNPAGPELLVRCERSRQRKTDTGFLWDRMAERPAAGILTVHVPRDGTRSARDARLEVRHEQVRLRSPKNKGYPSIDVFMVYAKEIEALPEVKEPLEWMLLTTVAVNDFDEACERLSWYAKRWCIEVYHRTLKSGCKIEDRRLETADGLQACLAIDMVVAWRVYHLVKLGREKPDAPCSVFFEEDEWKALHGFVNKTHKPPKKEPTLREATRMTASLGGFLGRKADKEPGATTIWRGLQRLTDITAAYRFFRSPPRDGP
jgi:hypothetical protein